MDDNRRYEAFVRNRITELREQKGISEHRMSLELGKSGSYIRSITNGISMPSLRELFNIMEYFDLTPTLFFAPMDDPDSLRGIITAHFGNGLHNASTNRPKRAVVYGCHPAPEKGTQGGTAANGGESPHIEESRAFARLSSPAET